MAALLFATDAVEEVKSLLNMNDGQGDLLCAYTDVYLNVDYDLRDATARISFPGDIYYSEQVSKSLGNNFGDYNW